MRSRISTLERKIFFANNFSHALFLDDLSGPPEGWRCGKGAVYRQEGETDLQLQERAIEELCTAVFIDTRSFTSGKPLKRR